MAFQIKYINATAPKIPNVAGIHKGTPVVAPVPVQVKLVVELYTPDTHSKAELLNSPDKAVGPN